MSNFAQIPALGWHDVVLHLSSTWILGKSRDSRHPRHGAHHTRWLRAEPGQLQRGHDNSASTVSPGIREKRGYGGSGSLISICLPDEDSGTALTSPDGLANGEREPVGVRDENKAISIRSLAEGWDCRNPNSRCR
ncbi:hypothetical protein AVEN_232424-1 [Araneus ventricosus]|uniref:Uncharacterized protein n=1 Tax=Araneus ventricosus TaxID=182803 RepID=A0A4Y2RZH2_ARAVE|nr:hypothetical protein AVEN_232424-1 [Araneus ventricosus]